MSLYARRALLKFLAASPVLAGLKASQVFADERTLASAAEALDVFDLEAAAEILNLELRLAMVGCGARSVAEVLPATLIDTGTRYAS